MSEAPYNPNDLAFLLSRSLDEELPESERQKLREALAASEALRAEAEQLRALDRLVKRWGQRTVELDWEHHAALAKAQAAADGDAEKLGRLDTLLDRWAGQPVGFDEERFTAAVMAKVRSERKRRTWQAVIFRLGTPLAAAAAVVFAVTATLWWKPATEPTYTIEIGPPPAMAAQASSAGDVPEAVVVFGQMPADKAANVVSSGRRSSAISFIAIAAARVIVGAGEIPP